MTDHDPDRTSGNWACRACSEPWPCGPAKAHMLATMRPTELAITQWMMLEQAMPDLQPISSREVWDRFLGWSRRDPLS